MRRKRNCTWILLGLVVVLCCGCSGESGPKTVPVSGTVTMQGKPVGGVTISFIPDGQGLSAVGVTDASGSYTLTTKVKDDGAVPGRYKVTLAKYDAQQGPVTDPSQADTGYDTSNQYPAGYDEAKAAAMAAPPSKNLFPEKYADPDSSGLTAAVIDGDNPPINFELEN